MQRERDVGRLALGVGVDRVAQQEVLRLDRSLADLDGKCLLRRRLREVVPQPFGEAGALALQVGHERQHRYGIPARRMGLGMEDDLGAGLDERLFGDRAPEELRDGVGDLVAGTRSRGSSA